MQPRMSRGSLCQMYRKHQVRTLGFSPRSIVQRWAQNAPQMSPSVLRQTQGQQPGASRVTSLSTRSSTTPGRIRRGPLMPKPKSGSECSASPGVCLLLMRRNGKAQLGRCRSLRHPRSRMPRLLASGHGGYVPSKEPPTVQATQRPCNTAIRLRFQHRLVEKVAACRIEMLRRSDKRGGAGGNGVEYAFEPKHLLKSLKPSRLIMTSTRRYPNLGRSIATSRIHGRSAL